MSSNTVIIEFQRIGQAVKVTAVDPTTLTEVSIQGPAHLSEDALTRSAVAKLTYVLKKRAGAPGTGKPGSSVIA